MQQKKKLEKKKKRFQISNECKFLFFIVVETKILSLKFSFEDGWRSEYEHKIKSAEL